MTQPLTLSATSANPQAHLVPTEQAMKAMERANDRLPLIDAPALLAIMSTERSKDGKRVMVKAHGFAALITVWSDKADQFKALVKDAPKTALGFPVIPVMLNAHLTEVAERKVEGTVLPARTFYNLSARPFVSTKVEDLFA